MQNLTHLCNQYIQEQFELDSYDLGWGIIDTASINPLDMRATLNQPIFNEFNFDAKNEFEFVCDLGVYTTTSPINGNINHIGITSISLVPQNRMPFDTRNSELFSRCAGISYLLTAKINGQEHIVYIGHTTKTFSEKLQIFNDWISNKSEQQDVRLNINWLNTMDTMKLKLGLYIYPCNEKPINYVFHGV